MILVSVSEDGTRYESYGKTDQQLRAVQQIIREKKTALCPECLAPVQIVIYSDGLRTNHFRHLANDDGCGYGKGESEEHLLGKTAIRRYLESKPDWDGCEFLFEHRIETPVGVRIVDLAVIHPNGEKEAHEAQLSKQSLSEFDERSAVYQNAGFTPIWWIGGNNANARQHIYDRYGWVGEIRIEERPVDFGEQSFSS